MTLSEFAVTIPGWLTVTLAAACVGLSIQLFRWYIEETEPCPCCRPPLPFVAQKDENEQQNSE